MAASNTRFTQNSLGQSKTPIDSDHGIYRHFGNVRVHGSIRHDQHDVRTAPAAFIPWLEL